jgi:hypothetical protein
MGLRFYLQTLNVSSFINLLLLSFEIRKQKYDQQNAKQYSYTFLKLQHIVIKQQSRKMCHNFTGWKKFSVMGGDFIQALQTLMITSFNSFHGHCVKIHFLVLCSNNKPQHPTNCAPEPRETAAPLHKATARNLPSYQSWNIGQEPS